VKSNIGSAPADDKMKKKIVIIIIIIIIIKIKIVLYLTDLRRRCIFYKIYLVDHYYISVKDNPTSTP
jgi:hypothetical protein